MLKYITGDITDVTSGIILQQVNCQNTMRSGLAKAIFTKWPIVKKRYHEFCAQFDSPEDLLGETLPVDIPNSTITVVNSFSQLNYGYDGAKYTDEDILIYNIRTHAQIAKALGIPCYIPHGIGCVLGGGNWDTIVNSIEDKDVIVVSLPKDDN